MRAITDVPVLIRRFADAASLALVGASNNPLKWGNRILRNIVDGGYAGRVYPVNPGQTEIAGVRAYPSVASLPEVPDVALICVPAPAAARALGEAARAGVRSIVVITSGFAEAGDERAERELARVARDLGVAMVGPNSMGFFSARARIHALMPTSRPPAGGISLVSQSGNVGSQAMGRAHLHGVGFSVVFSAGNMAALDWADYLDALAPDKDTRVIALYLEGVREGARFLLSLRAAAAIKPVILTKGGTTEAGARAARSHSAALASPMAVFAGAVRQAGGLLVRNMEEMMDVAAALDVAPLPRGPRVGIITWGGGWGVIAADACVAVGLEVPDLAPSTRAALDELLPAYWSKGNPVDLAGGLDHAAHLRALEVIARAPGLDAILLLGTLSSPDPYLGETPDIGLAVARAWGTETAERAIALAAETGKPIIGVAMGGVAPPPEAVGRLPVYHTPDRAVSSLARMLEYARIQNRLGRPSPEVVVDRAGAESLLTGIPGGTTLSEAESLELLASYAVPTVARERAATESEALQAARRLGFPVVLKASGRGIAHKTERGLVITGIATEERLIDGWREIAAAAPEGTGMLVQRMISSRREFAMGVVRDPTFGPCVMFGQGGVYAEAIGDVAFRTAGLGPADAEEMIEEVRARALLGALRGEPAVNRRALAEMLVRLGRLALDFPSIAEIDVNPVLVPQGEPLAADALVILGS